MKEGNNNYIISYKMPLVTIITLVTRNYVLKHMYCIVHVNYVHN